MLHITSDQLANIGKIHQKIKERYLRVLINLIP